jgi:uncharacterized protein (TIGR02231 family)
MWKRAVPSIPVFGLLLVLVFATTRIPADPPKEDPPTVGPALKEAREAARRAPAALGKTATSRVVAVTVYPNSALVTREVDVPEGAGTTELVVTPLPPTTVNSSLYTEGTDGVRVLTTRFRTRPVLEDTREDVRKLQEELAELESAREKLEADIKAVQADTAMLDKMEKFMTVTTVQATEKAVLNSEAPIAMAKYIRESRRETARELVTMQQQVQVNQTKAVFANRKLADLATGTTRTERDAVLVVEKANAAASRVRLNYLVDAASWAPQYRLRAGKTAKDPVRLEYLAAVVQHSGEDWSGVEMVLSTAQPMLNATPPELQSLQVAVVPKANSAARSSDLAELEEQVRSLRTKAQKDFNERKQSSGIGLMNTAAALDQSWELFNPEAAMKRGCAIAVREGPTVTYHLDHKMTVPSRNDEQVLEVARLDLMPDYYYKAVPLLTAHVYRMADLVNKSNTVLLPGEGTMYSGTDFVGRMSVPLVAVGETFTLGFGIDPALQVQRQMSDRGKTTQGANQLLRYEYEIRISSFKPERVRVQVWDRLPHAESETVGVSLVRATPELSKEAQYTREQRPSNLLRWDVDVAPGMSGEKAVSIRYEFKLELDRTMAISNFQSAGVFAANAAPNPSPAPRMALTST